MGSILRRSFLSNSSLKTLWYFCKSLFLILANSLSRSIVSMSSELGGVSLVFTVHKSDFVRAFSHVLVNWKGKVFVDDAHVFERV